MGFNSAFKGLTAHHFTQSYFFYQEVQSGYKELSISQGLKLHTDVITCRLSVKMQGIVCVVLI